jgi:hypothetical protein
VHVFELSQPIPEINVYENNDLNKTYKIDTLTKNPDLKGQFFHSSIRILSNSAVMIDGVLSKSRTAYPTSTDINYEGIRLQPFFLKNVDHINGRLVGKGLFERGLHFSGTITPSSVRCICICDQCRQSFTLKHSHAGFSEVQYFYSEDSKETLTVSYNAIEGVPRQLETPVDEIKLQEVEHKLSACKEGFHYYYPLRCPYCAAPFIDFEKYKEIRLSEYYGNTFINSSVKHWQGSSETNPGFNQ